MDEDVTRSGSRATIRSVPLPAPDDDAESASAPSIPSFASLRDTRRRSPVDLLLTPQDPAVEVAALPPAPTGSPRPAEWVDLWHLGLRLARWWVRQPLETARRLMG